MTRIAGAVVLGKGSSFYPPLGKNEETLVALAKISGDPVCFSISRNRYVEFSNLRLGEVFKVENENNNLYIRADDE